MQCGKERHDWTLSDSESPHTYVPPTKARGMWWPRVANYLRSALSNTSQFSQNRRKRGKNKMAYSFLPSLYFRCSSFFFSFFLSTVLFAQSCRESQQGADFVFIASLPRVGFVPCMCCCFLIPPGSSIFKLFHSVIAVSTALFMVPHKTRSRRAKREKKSVRK